MAYIDGKEILFIPTGSGGTTDIVVPDTNTSERGSAGLVYMYNKSSGLRLDDDKRICIAAADSTDISEKTSMNKPIVAAMMEEAMQANAFTGDISTILSSSTKADTPAGAFAIKDFVLKNVLNFKLYKIPKGGTFAIKPGMMGIILPSTTLSTHVGSASASASISSMGTTIFMATDTGADASNPNSHWLAFLYVSSLSMKSNHTLYTSTCYIKNDDNSSSGTYAYVYYIERN